MPLRFLFQKMRVTFLQCILRVSHLHHRGQVAAALLPSPPLIPCQTEPAALAHTHASNISNALVGKAMWSCPSLPATQHETLSPYNKCTLLPFLAHIMHTRNKYLLAQLKNNSGDKLYGFLKNGSNFDYGLSSTN